MSFIKQYAMFPTKFAIAKHNAHPQISFCHIMKINKFIQSIFSSICLIKFAKVIEGFSYKSF